MLKRLLVCATMFVVVFGFHTSAFAQEKIALVDLQQALNNVNEGKKVKDKLKKEYEAKKKQIDSMKSELEKIAANLEKQSAVLSEDALVNKRKELQAKFMDYQNKAANYERELRTKEAENAKRILNKLRSIVLDLSRKNGYTLVLENSAQMVLYSINGTDITPDVISAYNKKK